jgi:hypothetical protein
MKTMILTWFPAASLIVVASLGLRATNATAGSSSQDELIKALAGSKHSLADGMQQVSKALETAISAKFELEDGKLSLSVYTAGKGLAVEAEHNVLQEYAGSPEAAVWKPEVQVFKDVEHVSRASEQLTLASLSPSSLADVLKKAAKDHPGTVYSITPVLRDRKAAFAVLVADQGKSTELLYDLLSGEQVKPTEAGAPKK